MKPTTVLCARFSISNDRDRVIVGVGDVEQLARIVDEERVRCRALWGQRCERGGEALDHLERLLVSMTWIVLSLEQATKSRPSGRELHVVGVHSDVKCADDLVGRGVDDAD